MQLAFTSNSNALYLAADARLYPEGENLFLNDPDYALKEPASLERFHMTILKSVEFEPP